MKRKKRRVKSIPFDQHREISLSMRNRWILYPVITFSGMVVCGTIFILLLSRNLPSLTELERAGDPLLVTRIVSRDGIVLKQLFRQKRIKVPLDQIPPYLINAVIANEDRRFYNHWGLDSKRLASVVVKDIISLSKREGASTLTQQLARKLYLHPRKTFIRKFREQLTAIQIERTYSKPEILEMYLNQMPLGRGSHGIQSAAWAYFRKNVEDLSITEAAMVVGMFQLPYGYYSPDSSHEAAVRRRNIVMRSMVACNYLDQDAYDTLKTKPLGVIDQNEFKDKAIAPYFCEYVTRNLEKIYGMRLWTDGLTIETTLDTRVQACADSAIKTFLPEFDKEYRQRILDNKMFTQWFDPPLESEEEIHAFLSDTVLVDSLMELKATAQVALTAMDPANGHILAWIGGRDFKKWKYNRAIQMARQPGSSFKPIAYTVAIDNGWPTTTELLNQPVVIYQADGTEWRPKNYDGSTGGRTTLREALRRSLNMVTVRLVQEVIPPQKVVAYAEQFGYTTNIHPFDGVALGQDVVIPLEHTAAYCVFANRGVWVEPTSILRVLDKNGNVLEETVPRRREVISEQTAYIMTDLLETVINKGTGQAARWKYNFYRPAAGKTGTTNDYRNAWFAGFTPQIVSSVWVGFDDERTSLGEDQTGAKTALPIWAPFMNMAHDTLKLPLADFVMPDGVVRLKICSESKKNATASCPDVWEEIFLENLAPAETCDLHQGPVGKRRNRDDQVIF